MEFSHFVNWQLSSLSVKNKHSKKFWIKFSKFVLKFFNTNFTNKFVLNQHNISVIQFNTNTVKNSIIKPLFTAVTSNNNPFSNAQNIFQFILNFLSIKFTEKFFFFDLQ